MVVSRLRSNEGLLGELAGTDPSLVFGVAFRAV